MSTITEGVKTALRVGVEIACKAVIASAMTALPILAVPGINLVFTWGVHWVAGKLLPHLEVFFVDKIIDAQVNAEKAAYQRAKAELQAVLEQHVTNPQELQNASDDFDRRLAKLVRIRP